MELVDYLLSTLRSYNVTCSTVEGNEVWKGGKLCSRSIRASRQIVSYTDLLLLRESHNFNETIQDSSRRPCVWLAGNGPVRA